MVEVVLGTVADLLSMMDKVVAVVLVVLGQMFLGLLMLQELL